MTKPLATLFIIADGTRARWVRRNHETHDFVTLRTIHADPAAPSGGRQGAVFESSTGRAFGLDEKADAAKAHRARFADALAGAINAAVEAGECERLAIVAPARTLAAIRGKLHPAALGKLAGTLAKDLTKTPDHALAAWLRGLEIG